MKSNVEESEKQKSMWAAYARTCKCTSERTGETREMQSLYFKKRRVARAEEDAKITRYYYRSCCVTFAYHLFFIPAERKRAYIFLAARVI